MAANTEDSSSSSNDVPNTEESSCSSNDLNAVTKTQSALIVSEDLVTSDLFKRVLSKNHGFQTYNVKNGNDAINLFRNGSRYDLVIMELELPTMDGIEATGEIRAIDAESYIIGVADSSSSHKIEEFTFCGLNHFMKRPIDLKELRSIIRAFV